MKPWMKTIGAYARDILVFLVLMYLFLPWREPWRIAGMAVIGLIVSVARFFLGEFGDPKEFFKRAWSEHPWPEAVIMLVIIVFGLFIGLSIFVWLVLLAFGVKV
jgi:hypothetical protein